MTEPRKITEARFGLAEHKQNHWFVTAEAGTTIEDVMKKEYWAYVSRQFRPYDVITVAIDTNDWMLILHVHSAGQTWANVVELHRYDNLKPKLLEAVSDGGSDLFVDWRGPHARYAVMRKSDGSVVKDRFQEKGLAEAYVRNFEGVKVA